MFRCHCLLSKVNTTPPETAQVPCGKKKQKPPPTHCIHLVVNNHAHVYDTWHAQEFQLRFGVNYFKHSCSSVTKTLMHITYCKPYSCDKPGSEDTNRKCATSLQCPPPAPVTITVPQWIDNPALYFQSRPLFLGFAWPRDIDGFRFSSLKVK